MSRRPACGCLGEDESLLVRPRTSGPRSDVAGHVVRGRRVLITGGGGSIGSELALRVSASGPDRLLLLDQDETHLHEVLARTGPDVIPVLADIRDRQRVLSVFAQWRPEVVLHTAGLKHVPLLERVPTEAVRTNVIGTENVVAAAVMAGVETFVFLSSDKAVRPSSVMGATKRVAERIVLAGGRAAATGSYSAVRFGNVLGTRGGVTATFAGQIASGGPMTLTDERMTRYFMTKGEAVDLILYAAAERTDGVFMLDMGEPVRVVDLATRMAALVGRRVGVDLPLVVTGVRPGEKLHEELVAPGERQLPTAHPQITRLALPSEEADGVELVVSRLAALADHQHEAQLRSLLLASLHERVGGPLP